MKIYSIKYIATTGKVEEFEGRIEPSPGSPQYATDIGQPGVVYHRFETVGKEAFTDKAEAFFAGKAKLAKEVAKAMKKYTTLRERLSSFTWEA